MKVSFENPQIPTDQIPSASDVHWIPVETRLRTMTLCGNLLYLLVLSPIVAFAIAGWLHIPEFFSEFEWLYQLIFVWLGALTIGLALLAPFFLFVWYIAPFFEVPRRKYAIRHDDLNYRRGLFKMVVSCAPFKRIQHASTHQNLYERMFNLSSLEVFTAAGRVFKIEGLSPKTAEELRDHVLAKISKFQANESPEENFGTLETSRTNYMS